MKPSHRVNFDFACHTKTHCQPSRTEAIGTICESSRVFGPSFRNIRPNSTQGLALCIRPVRIPPTHSYHSHARRAFPGARDTTRQAMKAIFTFHQRTVCAQHLRRMIDHNVTSMAEFGQQYGKRSIWIRLIGLLDCKR